MLSPIWWHSYSCHLFDGKHIPFPQPRLIKRFGLATSPTTVTVCIAISHYDDKDILVHTLDDICVPCGLIWAKWIWRQVSKFSILIIVCAGNSPSIMTQAPWSLIKMIAWWWWLFSHLPGFWGNVRPFISCLHFKFFFVFFLIEVEISSCTLIPLLRPGSVHSGSASWDNCGWKFPDKLHVNSFPERFPQYAWTTA